MKFKIFLILLLNFQFLMGQPFRLIPSLSRTEFFPDDKLFLSNFSDPFEPKIGSQFFLDKNLLELNIGSGRDLLRHHFDFRNSASLGIEFFNWTLLERNSQFRFPVIAVDYFFGGYLVFQHRYYQFHFTNRFRFSHISAHLADGSYDKLTSSWKEIEPFTYSREFIQWTLNITHKNVRLYFDLIYLFHLIPEMRTNTISGAGTEVTILELPYLKSKIFSGFDLKFQKILSTKFETNKSFSAGLILGNEYKTHFRLAYQYYSGYNLHGEFYFKKINNSFFNLSVVI